MQRVLLSLLILSLLAVSLPAQTPTAPERVLFNDIAATAGISGFQHLGGSPQKRYIIETTASGVGLIDYNRDGWLDIYFVNGGDLDILAGKKPQLKNRLYHNNGNGTFNDITDKAGVGGNGAWGQGVCVGDFDNDGFDDLYITNFGPDILYRNNGNGTFTDITEKAGVSDPRWSTGAAFGDYDSDGDLDLFVANYVELDLNKLPEPGGSGTGAAAAYCMYRGVPVMCGPRGLKGAGDALYRNNGDNTFTNVAKDAGVDDAKLLYGFQPTWIDYDNDNDLDIFVSNDSTGNYLYRNNGNGKFTDVSYVSGVAVNEEGRQQACMGVAWGDFNYDGFFDLYLTNFSDDSNTLYQNESGNFTDITFQSGHGQITIPYLGWGTAFFDYDNDGDLDVFVANGHVYPEVDKHDFGTTFKQRNLLFENNGQGKFTEIGLQSGSGMAIKRSYRGAAFGDLDNDGDIDVVVNAMDEQPLLLRNDGGNRNDWITIKLIGSKSNRAAIGTRVRARIGTRWQSAQVESGASYLSQNDLRIHFGLGHAAKVDELEIRWPSGARTRLTDLKVNKFYTIDEAKGSIQ
ncbi:MAG: CRTAC1 family protein [Acidobacteriota bacterium]